jgi:16S rRNA processing protein RimM
MLSFDDEQQPIGRITSIFETGANDVWVVKGDKEYLIPYIADVVKDCCSSSNTVHPIISE